MFIYVFNEDTKNKMAMSGYQLLYTNDSGNKPFWVFQNNKSTGVSFGVNEVVFSNTLYFNKLW